MQLHEIAHPISELKGIGIKRAKQLAWKGIETIADLLYYYPRDWEDRSTLVPLGKVLEEIKKINDEKRTIFVVSKAIITAHEWIGSPFKKTLKVKIKDQNDQHTGYLVCFGRNFLADQLRIGNSILIAGEFQYKFNQIQSSVFEFTSPSKANTFFRILPIYSLTHNLTQNFFRTAIQEALTLYQNYIDEDLDNAVQEEYRLLPLFKALKSVHAPASLDELHQGLRSLKFREFYHLYTNSFLAKKERESIKITPWEKKTQKQKELEEKLPFALTSSQKSVIEEINNDLCNDFPMERLLQGDVGCGKTLVAVEAALLAIENRKQVALMVPTELLAQQHADKIEKWLSPLGVKIALLTGKYQGTSKELLLKALKEGEIQMIVGTHSLFYSSVEFNDLGLIIIDEQHKFGVRQREQLKQKGDFPHLLLISATPIPRTLAQTLYGHLSISTITEIPTGRKPIKTHLCVEGKENSVYERVLYELEKGHQGYFVYPQIGIDDENVNENDLKENIKAGLLLESEEPLSTTKIKTAQENYERLSQTFFKKYRCALIHSGISDLEKEAIMIAFNRKEIDLLFSTTVIEVGIDNPNATIMVIESAQNFGLSTLHQLRGRIGRGSEQSYCFCIYHPALSESGKERLRTILSEKEGFKIAELDLKIRGPGEIYGVRQSGPIHLRLADIEEDQAIEKEAQAAALEQIKNGYSCH